MHQHQWISNDYTQNIHILIKYIFKSCQIFSFYKCFCTFIAFKKAVVSPCSKPCWQKLDQLAQSLVQLNFEKLKERRCHSLSWQPVVLLNHPHYSVWKLLLFFLGTSQKSLALSPLWPCQTQQLVLYLPSPPHPLSNLHDKKKAAPSVSPWRVLSIQVTLCLPAPICQCGHPNPGFSLLLNTA